MTAPLHCFGALALEIAAAPLCDRLDRDAADELAVHVAEDLQRLLPGVQSLDLSLAAAHFDPAELLRPRWPLHLALADLARRAPGAGRGRVIAFGASEGVMPASELQPDPALAGGPLRLLPFALTGEADAISGVARAIEERLLESGMAGAATALQAQQAFGGRLEHARYLSLHDLCAMTAMQYEHAGRATLWPLIEAALLAPQAIEWLDAPPEPLLMQRGGEVLVADIHDVDDVAPRHRDARRMRTLQLEAVLRAHAIGTRRVSVPAGADARAVLLAA